MFGFLKKDKNVKILDTSVLIDGRILKILRTGFLDGSLVVPNFVIKELQALCDSKTQEKRHKGHRGLDFLAELQKITPIEIVNTYSESVEKVLDVDGKLIVLSEEFGAKLITVDYALNKVAKTHGVIVLNINELFQAVKPPILVGDIFNIKLVMSGNQEGQAVGTLEDGSMVIVENSQHLIGEKVKVFAKTIFEKPAGRLIFAILINN